MRHPLSPPRVFGDIGRRFEPEVREDLVAHQREPVLPADRLEAVALRALEPGAGRVVWMHDEHGAGAVVDGGQNRGRVDGPGVLGIQREASALDPFQPGEVVEQRVAGRRRQD